MTAGGASPVANQVHPLLARSVQLKVYLALRKVLAPEAMIALREDHLRWVIEQERSGTLLMAGPVKPGGGAIALNGLMVFRANDAEEAARIANEDPFVVAGAMSCEICEWTIYEGCLPLTLTLSDSSLRLR